MKGGLLSDVIVLLANGRLLVYTIALKMYSRF